MIMVNLAQSGTIKMIKTTISETLDINIFVNLFETLERLEILPEIDKFLIDPKKHEVIHIFYREDNETYDRLFGKITRVK